MISIRTALVGLFLAASAASGAETREPGIGLELNRLEAVEGACRAYVVLQNDTDAAFSALRYDLVIFDADGIVTRRLALETAAGRGQDESEGLRSGRRSPVTASGGFW